VENKVREGQFEDAVAINQIYNWYVENSTVTFDIKPWTLQKRQTWFEQFLTPSKRYNLMVALEHNRVVGFAYNGQFRTKAAYDSSTEVTVYTHHDDAPGGTGSRLLEKLFKRIANTDLHRAYAVIALPNDASIRLHKKFDFKHIGTLDQVGTKFNRRIDVAWYQKHLN
jgi:phosphinothricin acetyltransferase